MEEDLKDLIATHMKANRLAKEIKKARGNIINAIKKKNSSDLDIEKLKYTGFAGAFDKETAIFNQLLKKIEDNNSINNPNINFNDSNFEITENSNSDSSSNTSEKLSLDNYSTIETKEEQKIEPEIANTSTKKDVQNELYQNSVPLPEYKTDKNVSVQTVSVSPSKKRAERRRRARNNKQKMYENDYPLLSKNKPVLNNKITNIKKGSKILSVSSGLYKYGGKGFEIFTGYRNQSRPIYSATMLYCAETCNGNVNELKKYLIEYGNFNGAMIEEIIFKFRGYYERYALIKVRGELKRIERKMEQLNKVKGNGYRTIISIYRRNQIINAKDVNNKLYVSNFDVLGKDSHKRFTNLFLEYGELMDDIRMGMDKYNNLYAIVYFRNVNGAKECIESELEFDGKVLNISYSKFQK